MIGHFTKRRRTRSLTCAVKKCASLRIFARVSILLGMKYIGSCHCQRVRVEADIILKELLSCNCSICSRRGHLLAFVPEKNFKLLSEEKNLADYQWGKRTIHFHFCKNCGCAPFGKGLTPDGPMIAINARCLENADLSEVKIVDFDGKHQL